MSTGLRMTTALITLATTPAAFAGTYSSRRSRLVLGDDGPHMVDRVLETLTPACPQFSSTVDIEKWTNKTRTQIISAIGIDMGRRPLSVELQHVVSTLTHRIEVVRFEIHPGVYMPANIYIPDRPDLDSMPLLINPTGCGEACWSIGAQRRAANFVYRGMAVIVTEGFCGNGMRASLPENNRHFGYARQLMGMRDVAFSAYLQELVSIITWALEHYPFVDSQKIGATGHSYGGHVALMLAQIDTRIASVSVGATDLGGPCDSYPLRSDLKVTNIRPNHVWLAPLPLPVLATNWRVLTVFPRALHATSGEADMSAPPYTVGGAMSYARDIYALAGQRGQVAYSTDQGRHAFNPRRRKGAYAWLAHTLLGRPLRAKDEIINSQRPWEELAVDISGTESFYDQLKTRIAHQTIERFTNSAPETIHKRVATAMSELFGDGPSDPPRETPVYEHVRGGVRLRGTRLTNHLLSFPVFLFENINSNRSGTLLYLPRKGTQQEILQITGFLEHYQRVISIDLLGIGELESDRLRLHTIARYLMHNRPSLPRINVDILRSFLMTRWADEPLDVWTTHWPTAFYGASLKWLKPERIDHVYLVGVPQHELRYLTSRKRLPDLLLWAGLFDKLSTRELALAIGENAVFVR